MAYEQVHQAIARARATTAHLATCDLDTRNEALLTASKTLPARADELLAAEARDRSAAGALSRAAHLPEE